MTDVAFFVGLERSVWHALERGDPEADRAVLAPSFLGVYPSGFANIGDHAGQLAQGATVAEHTIEQARIMTIADGHVLLSYLARYRRPNCDERESMYVSSLWSRIDNTWRNVFSQDTPVGRPDTVV